MKAKKNKEKRKATKHLSFMLLVKKKKKYVIIGILCMVVSIFAVTLFVLNTFPKESFASSKQIDDTKYEVGNSKEMVDINQILEENTKQPIKEELVTEEIDLEYTTIYHNNSDLPKGSIQVIQEGRDGRQQVVNKKVYEGDTLLREEQSGNVVTKAAVNKIVEVGTSKYSSNYKVKKGDTLYVTSYTLNVMIEPSKESEKVTTLNKGNQVTFIEKNTEGWYKITYGSFTGWVDGDCVTYLNPNEKFEAQQGQTSQGKSKTQLIAGLSQNMQLNRPSGLTIEQFKKVLSNNAEDKNKILEQNAEYFFYIEKQYNINGVFVAAVAVHESSWGCSKIALQKKNLFGYGASDGNAYNNAYQFGNYSEGIDLVARVFTKYYLNPAGTKIYEGETASGKYYSAPTLASVNKRYASDKNWASSVYKWMKYLYNRIDQ